MLAIVGPVEETSKFLAIRLAVYRSLHFEEPMDGLVYGAAASLGFASLENLIYVLSYGPEVMIDSLVKTRFEEVPAIQHI